MNPKIFRHATIIRPKQPNSLNDNELSAFSVQSMESPDLYNNACARKFGLCLGVRICSSGGGQLILDTDSIDMKTPILIKMKALLGIAVAGLLAKTAQGVVSLFSQLLFPQTPKEGGGKGNGVSRLREIFQTAGIGTIHGLLFAGLLFAPLPPHLAAQSNSPTNNSPTNSVSTPPPTDHPTGLGDFDDAYSEADCLEILNKKRAATWKKYEDAQKAARTAWDVCLTNRNNSLRLNEANLQVAYQTAKTPSDGLFWSCLGFGGGPATVGAAAGARWVVTIRGGSVAVSRVIGGIAGAVVGIGSLLACKSLANNDEASAREAANEVKEIQDEIARASYDQCMEANYRSLQDKADWWFRKYKRNRKAWERQYAKCVEF